MLREEFAQGGIIVENSPEVIVDAVRKVQAQPAKYRQEVEELRAHKERRWARNKAILMGKIGAAPRVAASV